MPLWMNMANESVPAKAGKLRLNSAGKKFGGEKEMRNRHGGQNQFSKWEAPNWIILPSTAKGDERGVRTMHGPHFTAW